MELFILFIIAFIVFVIVMARRGSGERKSTDPAFHSVGSSAHNDFTSLDPSSIAQAQFIYRQVDVGSGDSHSAHDSCAPVETAPGDSGGGNYSDSGGGFDSGGSGSTDGGSGSY